MKNTSGTSNDAADKLVSGLKRKTRKHYSAEENINIFLAGLCGAKSGSALPPVLPYRGLMDVTAA